MRNFYSDPGHAARAVIRQLALALLFFTALPGLAAAHFSYSDPRIVHLAELDEGGAVLLVRMPAPLALLPKDWQGQEDPRTPPFGLRDGDVIRLDPLALQNPALADLLKSSVSLWSDGARIAPGAVQYRFWEDAARPAFGTAKSAQTVFSKPADEAALLQASYFDLTLDVMITLPLTSLARELRLDSQLGQEFQVIEKLGTVVKLHRDQATETRAVMGVLDVSFAKVVSHFDILAEAAFVGAEHIYRGLDHLAMILLIAIAASGWRQALTWASAFTVGHVATLAAGLYGIAPSAAWFVPVVELAIVLSIVFAAVSVMMGRNHAMGWASLLIIGMIHGYGFAASASEALFAGSFDVSTLLAFALGLELCQFAIYALALPVVLGIDRLIRPARRQWRQALALGIAVVAGASVLMRLPDTTAAFGIT